MIAGDLSRTCCHGTLESFQVSCGSLDCLWFTGTNSSYINEQASSLFLVHFSSLLRLAPAVSPPRPRFSAPLAAPTNASYINVQRSLCYSVTCMLSPVVAADLYAIACCCCSPLLPAVAADVSRRCCLLLLAFLLLLLLLLLTVPAVAS